MPETAEPSPTQELPVFLRTLAAFACLQFLVLAGILAVHHYGSDNYLLANIDKERALRKVASPRIIFTGGSGVAFSVDTDMVRERLKPYEPVNMGVYVGVGLRYMLQQTAAGMREGDVVVLILEHELFINEGLHYGEADWHVLLPTNPRNLAYVGPRQVGEIFKKYDAQELVTSYLREAIEPLNLGGVYARHNFDAAGGLTLSREESRFTENNPKSWTPNEKIYQSGVAEIHKFAETCRKRKVRVCMIMPAYPDIMLPANEKLLLEQEARLRQDLPLPILSGTVESILPQKFFFDSQYHLNNEGEKRRTDYICSLLQTYLAENPGPNSTK